MERDETAYQGLWCLYLHARAYHLAVPEDVVCAYEPRPMTRHEAATYYLEAAGPLNHVIYQWNCADQKRRGGLAWAQHRRWAAKVRNAMRRWGEALAAVTWPPDASRTATRLVDRSFAEAYWLREAYRHPTRTVSVLSGDWAKSQRAQDQARELAAQLRLRLGLPQPPRSKKSCKMARAYERERRGSTQFTAPMWHQDLVPIASMLAEAGLIEGVTDEEGTATIGLTEAGLPLARTITALGDQATPETVLAALLGMTELSGKVAIASPEASADPPHAEADESS